MQHPTFNARLALTCARAAARAYVAATDSEPSTDTQYLILELPDRIIVAFRGSSSLADFIRDTECCTTRINLNHDERVHLGFYQALKSIELRLKNRLDELLARRADDSASNAVVFTGHSLGGALAILAAFYFQHLYNIEAVYTFGAPRVGNTLFATHYNRLGKKLRSVLARRTFCFANACDPVTWLPPYSLGYRHVGKFILLPGLDWLEPGIPLPRAIRWLAGAIQIFKNWRHGKLALLPNHSLKLYTQRLIHIVAASAATEIPHPTQAGPSASPDPQFEI